MVVETLAETGEGNCHIQALAAAAAAAEGMAEIYPEVTLDLEHDIPCWESDPLQLPLLECLE